MLRIMENQVKSELDIRVDEMKRLYLAIGQVLGTESRQAMSRYCMARVVELTAQQVVLDDIEVIHNSN